MCVTESFWEKPESVLQIISWRRLAYSLYGVGEEGLCYQITAELWGRWKRPRGEWGGGSERGGGGGWCILGGSGRWIIPPWSLSKSQSKHPHNPISFASRPPQAKLHTTHLLMPRAACHKTAQAQLQAVNKWYVHTDSRWTHWSYKYIKLLPNYRAQ